MKRFLALFLAVAAALALVACAAAPAENTAAQAAGLKKFTVTVVHADGSSREFSYETDKEFVGPVLQEAGLIEGNAGPYGMEITKVDGEQAVYNTDKAYWAVYVGEEYALQGIDTTPVTDGGVYKLEYTRG